MSTPSKRSRPSDDGPQTPTPVKRPRPEASSPGPSPQRIQGVSIRELSDLLDPDTFKTMVEDLRATEGEVLPAERSGAERTAAAAALALSNLLLLWSQGSHTLANTILGTVQRRVLGKDAENVDSVIVEGMEDTLKLLRDNTGPQGVTAREVLLAGCIPKGKDLGDDAPRLVKPKAPHTHSLQAVAQRLGVNVDRLPLCGASLQGL